MHGIGKAKQWYEQERNTSEPLLLLLYTDVRVCMSVYALLCVSFGVRMKGVN